MEGRSKKIQLDLQREFQGYIEKSYPKTKQNIEEKERRKERRKRRKRERERQRFLLSCAPVDRQTEGRLTVLCLMQMPQM